MSEEKPKQPKDDESNDVISATIGDYGRWQLLFTFLISLFNIPCTWHIFAPTFQAAEREMWCARTDDFNGIDSELWKNYTQPLGLCSVIDVNSIANKSILNDIRTIQNFPNARLAKCDKWEFEGEGKLLICISFIQRIIINLKNH